MELRQHYRYEATVRIRRDETFQAKPLADLVDGRRMKFTVGWPFEPEDTSIYLGEFAMIPDEAYREPGMAWIASGDLVDIRPLADEGMGPR